MKHLGRSAAVTLAAAIVLGTAIDDRPERSLPRVGEYWVLAGDFHVHAALGDGTLLPWELRREAQRAGLDVIAVTNHNTTFAARFAEWWARSFAEPSPLIIAGEEITSPEYHIVAVGLSRTVHRRQSAASAIGQVHAQSGVAIAAHPDRTFWSGYDDVALARLDGTEMVNSVDPLDLADYAEFRNRSRRRKPHIAAIGSSDFHGWGSMGGVRTYLLVRERSTAGVLDAIREGRTAAADDRGTLYGDAQWVQQIDSNRPAGRSDPNSGWRRFSVVCAWLGVLGLILLRR